MVISVANAAGRNQAQGQQANEVVWKGEVYPADYQASPYYDKRDPAEMYGNVETWLTEAEPYFMGGNPAYTRNVINQVYWTGVQESKYRHRRQTLGTTDPLRMPVKGPYRYAGAARGYMQIEGYTANSLFNGDMNRKDGKYRPPELTPQQRGYLESLTDGNIQIDFSKEINAEIAKGGDHKSNAGLMAVIEQSRRNLELVLESNDRFGVVMARGKYYKSKQGIGSSPADWAHLWKTWYNSKGGQGKVQEFLDGYQAWRVHLP